MIENVLTKIALGLLFMIVGIFILHKAGVKLEKPKAFVRKHPAVIIGGILGFAIGWFFFLR